MCRVFSPSLSLIFSFFILFSVNADATSEYEQWLKKNQQEFKGYLDKNDKEFLKILNANWVEIETTVSTKQIKDKKPKTLPVATPQQLSAVSEQSPAKINTLSPVGAANPASPIDKITHKIPSYESKISSDTQKIINVSFYGSSILMPYDKSLKQDFYGQINSKTVSKYWNKLAESPSKELIDELSKASRSLQLDDWGKSLLIHKYVQAMHKPNRSINKTSRLLTTWYLLVKSGFDARIAYNKQAFLLMPSSQDIFDTTFFRLNNKKYYAINLDNKKEFLGKVFTYKGNHNTASQSLNFNNTNGFYSIKNIKKKMLAFKFNEQKFNLSVDYSRDTIDFLNTYPQLGIEHYFAAGTSNNISSQILGQLKEIIDGKSERDAVNHLLRFVQTAFQYKTDEEQFNHENYLFPLETIHYPYSDCEDRAALFAWLVDSLLGLDIIIVNFPGHIATAVAFSQPASGKQWTFNDRIYTLTDPTYINANAGMVMPQYRTTQPTLANF